MKTTIEVPDVVYRQVKARSAMEGRTVREVVGRLLSEWLRNPETGQGTQQSAGATAEERAPAWFGSLRDYAANAGGRFDMDSVRRSIARGRRSEGRPS